MMQHPLNTIEWHDLPISKLSITEFGLELHVLPYNEDLAQYEARVFLLSDADSISFNCSGKLTMQDLDGLEVNQFDFQESGPGRMSGKIKIFPGSAGYWEIQFVNALWAFNQQD